MSKQGSSRAAMTSSACAAKVAFSRMSRETARKVGSIFAQAWYTKGKVGRRKNATVEEDLAMLCAGAVGNTSFQYG